MDGGPTLFDVLRGGVPKHVPIARAPHPRLTPTGTIQAGPMRRGNRRLPRSQSRACLARLCPGSRKRWYKRILDDVPLADQAPTIAAADDAASGDVETAYNVLWCERSVIAEATGPADGVGTPWPEVRETVPDLGANPSRQRRRGVYVGALRHQRPHVDTERRGVVITITAVKGKGIEAIAERLRRIRQNAPAAIGKVLGDTVRNIGRRFGATAPRAHTVRSPARLGSLALRRGGLVHITARHGKASEARTPAFNRAIGSSMKGIRARIRQALRSA